jgi:hypothetical protein
MLSWSVSLTVEPTLAGPRHLRGPCLCVLWCRRMLPHAEGQGALPLDGLAIVHVAGVACALVSGLPATGRQ